MSTKVKLVLKKNKKLDKIYHPETGLVFKSATEKLVIGRIDNDEFISLDETALELCEEYNFKYDESLVETEEVEHGDEEENLPTTTDNGEEDEQEENVSASEKEVPSPNSVEDEKVVHKLVEKIEKEEDDKFAIISNDSFDKSFQNVKNDLDNFFSGLKNELSNERKRVSDYENKCKKDSEKICELESQLSSYKKELEEVKRKLKGVLLAMQNDL